MIRVGFIVAVTDRSWIGGINYISNLINAVLAMPDRSIEPVLLVSDRTPDEILGMFPAVETIRSPIVAEGTWLRKVRKGFERGAGRDLIAEAFLRRHRIDVLSHSDQLGARASTPTIGWIADFQHVRMPEFFMPAELAARDRGFGRLAAHCDIVLLSSEDARRDLAGFAPDSISRARVLRFVSGLSDSTSPTPAADLRAKYRLPERFIFLPNQMWAHKNHGVVVDALAIARERGREVTVVCTGNTGDRRRPDYFPGLQQQIRAAGIETLMPILGLVPYSDVKGLYSEALAVLNPSFFEGWSTSVEEGKSQGKIVVLSDIPVHREQAPPRGRYFNPRDPAELAAILIDLHLHADPSEDEIHRAEATRALRDRTLAFGAEFTTIVAEAARGRAS